MTVVYAVVDVWQGPKYYFRVSGVIEKNCSEQFRICLGEKIPCTAWKVSKYGVFSDPYFPVFGYFSRSDSVRLC